MALPREAVVLLSALPTPAERKEERRGGWRAQGGHRGNDFEIFVAAHKFEGGGLAYLNTDRTFTASPALPHRRRRRRRCLLLLLLLLVRPLSLAPAAARPRLVLPLLDLTSPLFSFLVFLLHLPLLLLFGSRPPLSRER